MVLVSWIVVVHLPRLSCVCPVLPGLGHPARDIATMIANADPSGKKLPARLRGWNLDMTDGFGNAQRIQLKKLLGMIIHVYRLSTSGGTPSSTI